MVPVATLCSFCYRKSHVLYIRAYDAVWTKCENEHELNPNWATDYSPP